MNDSKILIAGIGNIFLGDDAFGVEVVKRLERMSLPPNAEVVDFGIKGMDLTYALLDGYETVILVDAVPRGHPPGTLYLVEPEAASDDETANVLIETHSLDPAKVLQLARQLGGKTKRVLLIGCEPSPWTEEEMSLGLSDAVAAAVDEAVKMVLELIEKFSAVGYALA